MKAFLVMLSCYAQAVSGLGAGTAPRSPTPRGTLCSTSPWNLHLRSGRALRFPRLTGSLRSHTCHLLYQVSPTSLNFLLWFRCRTGGGGTPAPAPASTLVLRLLLIRLGRPDGVGIPVPRPFGVGMPELLEPTLRLKSGLLRVTGVDRALRVSRPPEPGSSRSSN